MRAADKPSDRRISQWTCRKPPRAVHPPECCWTADRGRPRRAPRYAAVVKAKVLIRPKQGILDPQGKAVERALPALGFEGVSNVRVGRLVELDTDDPSTLDALCEKLLANPLIEDFEIELDGES